MERMIIQRDHHRFNRELAAKCVCWGISRLELPIIINLYNIDEKQQHKTATGYCTAPQQIESRAQMNCIKVHKKPATGRILAIFIIGHICEWTCAMDGNAPSFHNEPNAVAAVAPFIYLPFAASGVDLISYAKVWAVTWIGLLLVGWLVGRSRGDDTWIKLNVCRSQQSCKEAPIPWWLVWVGCSLARSVVWLVAGPLSLHS